MAAGAKTEQEGERCTVKIRSLVSLLALLSGFDCSRSLLKLVSSTSRDMNHRQKVAVVILNAVSATT